MHTFSLNEKQQEAVAHIEGPLLVLAGAGSGKTQVVTMRIAHLIEIGVPADEILALTFTNKAAEEMKRRIHALSGKPIVASTFHSLGARILRESIGVLGYTSSFTIYDENDSENLLKSCSEILGFTLEKGMIRSFKNGISQAKNDMLSPADFARMYTEPQDAVIASLYTAYQQKLKEYNAVDFDDLLFLTASLFQKHPEVLEIYRKRWSFLLVDEYQDTNGAQYALLQMLAHPQYNICVVGDPDQSIYSWRGANINNILNFQTEFEGATIIKLEQNYRSTSHILRAANSLISANTQRYEKSLWSALGDGEKVKVFFTQSDRDEALFVVKTLQTHLSNRTATLNSSVVFYRTNAQSRVFEDAFLRQKIPYVIVGGISFYQRKEIKDILSILRLSVSSSDFLSFQRAINIPKRGFGNTTLAKLQAAATESGLPILQVCKEALHTGFHLKLSKKQGDGLSEFLRILDTLSVMVKARAPLDQIVLTAVEKTGYVGFLRDDPDSYEERKENIDELVRKAGEWEEGSSLESFLEELTLKSSLDEKSSLEESVKLMTLHNGKGLEFDLTFLVGMEEELFPHINSKDSFEALEEERRLCYVGMTRAKRHLYLTGSTYRTIWGMPKVMSPSRFIDELPPEHTLFLNNARKSFYEEEEEKQSLDSYGFRQGMLVHHNSFGKGIIQKCYSTSMGPTYDIRFEDDNSLRSLVAKYAKLTEIN